MEWHWIRAIWNPSILKLHVNGIMRRMEVYSPPKSPKAPLCVLGGNARMVMSGKPLWTTELRPIVVVGFQELFWVNRMSNLFGSADFIWTFSCLSLPRSRSPMASYQKPPPHTRNRVPLQWSNDLVDLQWSSTVSRGDWVCGVVRLWLTEERRMWRWMARIHCQSCE